VNQLGFGLDFLGCFEWWLPFRSIDPFTFSFHPGHPSMHPKMGTIDLENTEKNYI
jgi:hypothetical protein